MCLLNPKWILDHTEDIVCYKVLHYDTTLYPYPCYISTQAHRGNYVLGKTRSLKNKKPVFKNHLSSDIWYIEGSALHSYAKLEDAVTDAKNCGWMEVYVIKCIIPKTSAFVLKGIHGYYFAENYVSQKLKPIEPVVFVNNHGGCHSVTYLNKENDS